MLYDINDKRFPLRNYLLGALPPDEFNFLRPQLEPVCYPVGTIYADFCDPLEHCFFPNRGMISLLSVTEAGQACEVGYIGFEGLVGMAVVIGKNEMPYQALVQAATDGYKVPVDAVIELFNRGTAFHDLSLRFAYVLLRQFAQTSACNRFHGIQARLCRWLAIMCERSECNNLRLTQEFLAYMLGVQRTSIATIAHGLQDEGIISYSRGKIDILDLERLRASACECLSIIDDELAGFLANKKIIDVSAIRQTVAR